MRRLFGTVLGLVLAWLLGVCGAAAALPSSSPGPPAHAHDAHIAPSVVTSDSLERGLSASRSPPLPSLSPTVGHSERRWG